MTQRRKFVLGTVAAILTSPVSTFAQPTPKPWRVGYLSAALKPTAQDPGVAAGLPKSLSALGYIEGRDFQIDWKFAEGKYSQLDMLAAELVNANVHVIVTANPNATRAAQKATSTIPIIFLTGGDPVLGGFVKSLARPGGNITGFYNLSTQLVAKQLELLREAVPGMKRVAVLANSDNPSHADFLKVLGSAAAGTGATLITLNVNAANQIAASMKSAQQKSAQGLIVLGDSFFITQRQQIVAQSNALKMPLISVNREYVEAGGLMQYGWNSLTHIQRAASYIERMLKEGLKPSDLPVEQSKNLDMVINAKTAHALGITIPATLTLRATEVIE